MGPYQSIMGCCEEKFGCFPSCIFRTHGDWLQERHDAAPEAQLAIDAILSSRLYERHGADHCASLNRQALLCDPLKIGPSSDFEWILSPRLRQVGCFQPGRGGTDSVVYFRWVVA